MPEAFKIDDSAIIPPAPAEEAGDLPILRGPNIKEFPASKPQEDTLEASLGAEGRRQYHYGPYHAGRFQDPAV